MKLSTASSLVKLGFSVSHLARVGASKISWKDRKLAAYDTDGKGRNKKGGGGGLEKISPAKQKLHSILSGDIGHAMEKQNFDLGILSKQPSNYTWPHSVAQCQEFVDCVDGMAGSDTCADACAGNCCVGAYACDGFTGMVCKDQTQTSCNGVQSCFYANIGEVNGGCQGDYACNLAGYDGSIAKVENSCLQGSAAYGFSCYGAAFYSGGEIGEIVNSCQGDVTCVFAASYGGKIGRIYESCIGERWSCWRAADSGTIGNIEDSCKGISACDRFSYYGTAGDMTGACKSYEACYFAAESGTVGPITDGCNGDYGCFDLAYYGLVGEVRAACNAENACLGAGNENAGAIPSGIIDCCNQANECAGDNESTLPSQCVTTPPTPPPTPPSPVTPSPTPATTMPPTTSGATASKSGKKSKTGKSGKASKGSKAYQSVSMNLYARESESMSFYFN